MRAKASLTLFAVESFRSCTGFDLAFAGVWNQAHKGGFLSSDTAREISEFGDAWRSASYLEYGVSDDFTLVTKLETLQRDNSRGGAAPVDGQLAVRSTVYHRGNLTASVQAGLLLGENTEVVICRGTGMEARSGLGYSASASGSINWFVQSEIAWRDRGGCQRWKADLAAGVDFLGLWSLHAKGFYEEDMDADRGPSLKLETRLMRRLGHKPTAPSLGVAYRREVGGTFEEEAFIVGLSKRF